MKALPRHKFWGAGEPDCPPELKAPNGELHTMRCKVCGNGWRKSVDVCFGTDDVVRPAPGLHLAGNFRALLTRHARSLNEPVRGAVEQAAELIDRQRLVIERTEELHAAAVRREAHLQAALRTIMRMADEAKEPCGTDPESPAAIRNGRFAGIAQVAAQGIGWIHGPALSVQTNTDLAARLHRFRERHSISWSEDDCSVLADLAAAAGLRDHKAA